MLEVKIKDIGAPLAEEFRKIVEDNFIVDLSKMEIRFQDEKRKLSSTEKIYLSFSQD